MLGLFGWLSICMCQFCHDEIILLILCLYTKLLFTCNTICWNFSNFCLRDTFSWFTEMVFSTRMAQKSSSKKFLNMHLEKGKVLFNVLLIFSSWVAFLYPLVIIPWVVYMYNTTKTYLFVSQFSHFIYRCFFKYLLQRLFLFTEKRKQKKSCKKESGYRRVI